mgnify:FL=1
MVLDVKNKTFIADNINSGKLVSSADMYQIIFYCNQLKANVGCLIYPSSETTQPIAIDIDNQDLKIYLLSVDMSACAKDRQKNIVRDIKSYVYPHI